jgi:hypothetical protein
MPKLAMGDGTVPGSVKVLLFGRWTWVFLMIYLPFFIVCWEGVVTSFSSCPQSLSLYLTPSLPRISSPFSSFTSVT